MKNNKTLWILFGVLQHIASWVGLVIYTWIKYGDFIAKNGIVLAFGFALVFAIWMIMRSLKETAEHGFGLFRKIARSVRLFIPLVILLVFVLAINKNIANMVDIIVYGVAGNLIALPLGVLSYYASPQYLVDTGMVDVVNHINKQE